MKKNLGRGSDRRERDRQAAEKMGAGSEFAASTDITCYHNVCIDTAYFWEEQEKSQKRGDRKKWPLQTAESGRHVSHNITEKMH